MHLGGINVTTAYGLPFCVMSFSINFIQSDYIVEFATKNTGSSTLIPKALEADFNVSTNLSASSSSYFPLEK